MRQYERFSQYLTSVVLQTGLHKNEMIRNLEIDRSSYFQILRGSRLPTKEQYLKLKKLLLLPKEENLQLDDRYYRAAIGEDAWENILHVRDFICLLSETEKQTAKKEQQTSDADVPALTQSEQPSLSPKPVRYLMGRNEVKAGIREILEEAHFSKELDYFLPENVDFFNELLQQLIPRVREDFLIRQLVGFSGGRASDRKKAISVFQGLLMFMSARVNVHLDCRYYYNSISKVSDIGLLYPWYIICGAHVMLIASDFCSAVSVRDEEMIKAFSDQFRKAFSESMPVLKSIGSLEQNLQAVREFLQGKREVNYEAIPCTAMIATPQMIRKYVIPQAQEDLIAHCETLQRDETMIDISSISGLKKFLKSGKTPEIPDGFMRPIETEDLIWYLDCLLERLGNTLFIIDESRIPAAYDWDITIIEEHSVLVHRHNYDTMILDEKNLVDMFTSFAGHIAETPFVLETAKARKELLDIRSELLLKAKQG